MVGAFIFAASLLAIADAPAAQTQRIDRIELVAYATYPDGQRHPAATFSGGHQVMYIYARPTICEAVVSATRPDADAYGWEVETSAWNGGRTRVAWTRLTGATSVPGLKEGGHTLAAGGPPAWFALDKLERRPEEGCDAVSFSLETRAIQTVRPPASVALTTRSSFPGGDQKETSRLVISDVRKPTTVYVVTPATVCEPSMLLDTPPEGAAYAWKVDIVPLPADAGSVAVRWTRIIFGGEPARSAAGERRLTSRSGAERSHAVLDSVDGGSRLEIRRRLEVLRDLDPGGDAIDREPEISADAPVAQLRAEIRALERRLVAVQAEGRGDRHPDVVGLRRDIDQMHAQLHARKAVVLRQLIARYESATTPLPPVRGCNALSMTLEAELTSRPAVGAMEAELWFVHRTPEGKEATQRQVVRLQTGERGYFYFDDLNLALKAGDTTIPIAVEVFGAVHTGLVGADGQTSLSIELNRRYVNREVAIGTWPKTGRTDYPLTVTPGEVVSFVLPPLQDDGGLLLGHRFSVRLRLRPADGRSF